MTPLNPGNERVKYRYAHELIEGDGLDRKTVEHTMYAIEEFEQFTGRKDFRLFNSAAAEGFRKHLLEADPPPSLGTANSKLTRLAKFVRWLSDEPGFRQSVRGSDGKYFLLSNRHRRVMKELPVKRGPSVADLQKVVRRMSTTTPREWRDKALVALIVTTGIRISAAISLKLRHVREDGLGINQNGAEVDTKQHRSFTSILLPLGEDICGFIPEYVHFLRTQLSFTDTDPLFPASNRLAGLGQGSASDVSRVHWKSDGSARRIVKTAFEAAGVPYFTPHTARHSLAKLSLQIAPDPATLIALSQNLGHKSLLTTLTSYVSVSPEEQIDLIRKLHRQSPRDDDEQTLILLEAAVAALRRGLAK